MDEKEKKRTVRIFALASFLNDLGSDMIYPIWPLFVTSILGANMAILGFIDGLGDAVVSISQAVSGYLSDRIRKRKAFVWLGYLFGSLSRIGYALSKTWMHLVPFRVIDRSGKIRSAPRDAIIADISTKKDRCENFGLLRAMDNLGAVCGIVACIFLFKPLGYRKLFFLAAVPSVIGALLVISFIKEKRPPKENIYKGLSIKDFDKNFKFFLLLSSFFYLGSFSYSFLLIYAKEFGFRVTYIPFLYLIFTAAASVFSIPFGRLSDKIGRKRVLTISYLLWGCVCLCFIFARSYISVILTFVLYGMHKGALVPVQTTFVSELAPEGYKASALGGFQMVVGLCALPASFIAGILWNQIGILVPLYFSLFLTIISISMLFFVKERAS